MDFQRDYEPFKRLLSRLCVTFDKFANDELVESWWKALRDVPLADVQRRIEAFIARAGEDTKFPRPGQMRPADVAVVVDPKDEARDRRMREENARNWDDFCRKNPITGHIRRRHAAACAIVASTSEHTVAHAEAVTEMLHLEKQLGERGRFSADR